jgi:hypothetical protein
LEILAIKTAIQQESAAFYGVDYALWQRCWVHEPYVFWSYADSSGASYVEGWSALDAFFHDYFKYQFNQSESEIGSFKTTQGLIIKRDWHEVRLYGNAAFVRFVQRIDDKTIDRDDTEQIRMLEKHDGKWLITYSGALAQYPAE